MRTFAQTLIAASLAGVLLCPRLARATDPSRRVPVPPGFAAQLERSAAPQPVVHHGLRAQATAVTLPGSGRLVVSLGQQVFVVDAKTGTIDKKRTAALRTGATRADCPRAFDLAPAGDGVHLSHHHRPRDPGDPYWSCTLALRWNAARSTVAIRLVDGDPWLLADQPVCRQMARDNAAGLALWKRGRQAAATRLWTRSWAKNDPRMYLEKTCRGNTALCGPEETCGGLTDLCGNLGFAMFKSGDDLNAAHFLASCPGATARLNQGDAYAAAGWTRRAVERYGEALKAGLVGRQRARAKATLAKLRAKLAHAVPTQPRPFAALWGAGPHDVLAYGQGLDGTARLYRTRDLGRSWKAVPLHAGRILAIAGSGPSDVWVLEGAGQASRLWHSREDGGAFVQIAVPFKGQFRSLHVSKTGAVLVIGQALDGTPLVLWSGDHGTDWQRAVLPEGVESVTTAAGAGRELYLVGETSPPADKADTLDEQALVLRSRDGGRRWRTVSSGGGANFSFFSAVAATPSGVVLAGGGTRQGMGGDGLMLRSDDHGRHWSGPSEDDWVTDATYNCYWSGMWLGPGGQAVIVGDKSLCAVEYSTDSGASFRHPKAMPPALAGSNTAVWGTKGAVFVTGTHGVFVSTDGGATWQDRTPR